MYLFADAVNFFIKDNFSLFYLGTLRELHYQVELKQGKLVQVILGSIFDVAVDLRPNSVSYSQWLGRRFYTMCPCHFRSCSASSWTLCPWVR
ncbi:hypothetical protein DRM94_05790 [Aeromonas taiwanensis]|uniref:dTDP-4-dehydrorhamnose 3,5-epimerase n=1 Tax=Aeromonas taiwanensis TaxID=633417 RepID=A0A5F0KDF4_9GAMM|nr:dTDP-4-dehydrorhamnose 3,5-epimerase family protein [Aeromonas taiwanensis]TFF78415.1 hypothetical protein DRM93_05790 [Aeromonas taiwanensis]TFF79013.1 hypothetical protein DRM95_06750 [Aeromonas taiwanensis]TFF82475.1 hypothetical protein DRM94_05790 [Aeromonas taiwanensis]